jgi:hypothetical protein
MVIRSAPDDRLAPEVAQALAGARTPKFLATRNSDGIPNVVPVISLQAADERTIIFGELMIWKTRRNLESDSRVSVMVLAPDLRAWTIKGRFVEFQHGGPHFDRLMATDDIRYNAYSGIRSAAVIEVLDVPRAVRFSQAGLLLDSLRGRWLARRLSRDGRAEEAMPVQVGEKFSRLRAAKALAYLDGEGHPDCLPVPSMVPAGLSRLIVPGADGPASGSPVAASVITLEPVAYQVKGVFAGTRRSLGRTWGIVDVREAYSASPPLSGQRLPARSTGSPAAKGS